MSFGFVHFEDGTYREGYVVQKSFRKAQRPDPAWRAQTPAESHEDRFWSLRDGIKTGKIGAASLKDMATMIMLQNPHILTSEALKDLPWALGKSLWNRILTT